ncbi:MAG: Bsp6I family type II restriction endonuclease [Anaplasmataceae bacterium]|nr:Bsp6I family type II restriction endonuclease [Anaplasmataceae bacterium]
MQEIIRKNIKKIRESKKISQEKMSLITGFERSYISQIENGHKNIGIENLYKIASSLNVAVIDFFIEKEEIPFQDFSFQYDDKELKIKGQCFEKKNVNILKNIYIVWQTYSNLLKISGDRQSNVPSVLSEGIISYLYRNIRVHSIKGKGADSLKTSMDNFNIHTKKRIQVKSTCIQNDCTSFGPKTDYDELLFIDFYDEKIRVFNLSDHIEILKSTVLNKKKNETFLMQQQAGRRPRLSLKKDVIVIYKIKSVVEFYMSEIDTLDFLE